MSKPADRDPGDAVPPGVAPEAPPPPGPEGEAVKERLKRLPKEREAEEEPPKAP